MKKSEMGRKKISQGIAFRASITTCSWWVRRFRFERRKDITFDALKDPQEDFRFHSTFREENWLGLEDESAVFGQEYLFSDGTRVYEVYLMGEIRKIKFLSFSLEYAITLSLFLLLLVDLLLLTLSAPSSFNGC